MRVLILAIMTLIAKIQYTQLKVTLRYVVFKYWKKQNSVVHSPNTLPTFVLRHPTKFTLHVSLKSTHIAVTIEPIPSQPKPLSKHLLPLKHVHNQNVRWAWDITQQSPNVTPPRCKFNGGNREEIINIPYFLDQTPRLLFFFFAVCFSVVIIQGQLLFEGNYYSRPVFISLGSRQIVTTAEIGICEGHS